MKISSELIRDLVGLIIIYNIIDYKREVLFPFLSTEGLLTVLAVTIAYNLFKWQKK